MGRWIPYHCATWEVPRVLLEWYLTPVKITYHWFKLFKLLWVSGNLVFLRLKVDLKYFQTQRAAIPCIWEFWERFCLGFKYHQTFPSQPKWFAVNTTSTFSCHRERQIKQMVCCTSAHMTPNSDSYFETYGEEMFSGASEYVAQASF